MASLDGHLPAESVEVSLTLSPRAARCTLVQEGQTDRSVTSRFKIAPLRNPRIKCASRGHVAYEKAVEVPDGQLETELSIRLERAEVAAVSNVQPPRTPSTTKIIPETKTPRSDRDAGSTKAPIKSPPLSASGPSYLSINTRPWTKVYVDGRFVRNTPLMRYEVPSGAHRVTLINEDFNIRETVTVRVQPGENKTVIRNLANSQ